MIETAIQETAIASDYKQTALPKPGGNYVMQGIASEKALDIYHLIFAPTHACNLRCKHCYLPDHHALTLPKEIALRLVEEWSEIVLDERGPFRGIFHIKGGEPFLVPYLGEIMDRLVELQSLRIMFTTNGTFTGQKVLDRIAACNDGLHGHMTMIVSLDGASPETHEALRGEGQFEVTMGFLEAMCEMGIHTHLNCVLHNNNVSEVLPYIQMAQSLKIEQINFLPLVPKGYGEDVQFRQAPHLKLHQELQRIYDSLDDEARKILAGSLSHIVERETKSGICAACECVAAYRGLFYITPEGSAFTCPNLLSTEHSIGNVNKTSLRELCDRLPKLYNRLRNGGSNDKYFCTGERELYEKRNDKQNLESLQNLQNALTRQVSPSFQKDQSMAYCVSRNF